MPARLDAAPAARAPATRVTVSLSPVSWRGFTTGPGAEPAEPVRLVLELDCAIGALRGLVRDRAAIERACAGLLDGRLLDAAGDCTDSYFGRVQVDGVVRGRPVHRAFGSCGPTGPWSGAPHDPAGRWAHALGVSIMPEPS